MELLYVKMPDVKTSADSNSNYGNVGEMDQCYSKEKEMLEIFR